MLAKSMGSASATAPKAQGLLDPCFKCGQKGHWAWAYPNPRGPRGLVQGPIKTDMVS